MMIVIIKKIIIIIIIIVEQNWQGKLVLAISEDESLLS